MCAQQVFFFAKRAEKVGNIAKRNAAVRESTIGLNPLRDCNRMSVQLRFQKIL